MQTGIDRETQEKEVKEILMNDFVKGFIHGAKETPRGFFAPVILLWRLFIKSYDSVIQHKPGVLK